MAVVNNTATEVGDVIQIIVDTPVVGLLALTSFIDTTENETGTRFFQRLFRYSTDGINYSNWITLTNPNLMAVSVQPTDVFYVQYRYIRAGTDISGTLVWDNVTLNGTFATLVGPPIYQQSIFNDYFTYLDIDVLNWAINVLEKLYKPGMIPAYITRYNDTVLDKDFINFWKSVTIFFSYLVQYARVFENFTTKPELCVKYLENAGTYVCGDETLDELLYLIANRLRDRAKRGTLGMILPGGGIRYTADSTMYTVDTTGQPTADSTLLRSTSQFVPDGELLRLICYSPNDYFKLAVPTSKFNSWCVGNSSPMYRSDTKRIDMNLGYENSQDVLSLTPYPLLQSSFCSIVSDSGKSVLQINAVPTTQKAGIGDGTAVAKAIVVDPGLNYEITFQVRQPSLNTYLTFGAIGMDALGNIISLKSIVTGANTQNFFSNVSMAKNDRYYFVRGIIYNSSQALLSATNAKTNLGIGANLQFPSTVKKIIPYIILDNNTGGTSTAMYLWNVKVNQTGQAYSRCFINNKNFIDITLKNNNAMRTNKQIDAIMRKYLLSYNSSFKSTYL